MSNPAIPFAVSAADLQEAEEFCKRSGLDQIGKICAELRILRQEYLLLAKRVGMNANAQPDPILANRRFSKSLDKITKAEDPFDLPDVS